MSADVKETAAVIRRSLREQFPGVRFTVRMDHGTAWGWIHVGWVDGPTVAEVEAITARFESSRFDAMTDTYQRTGHNEWTCRGISTSRRLAPERVADALARVFVDPETNEPALFTEDGEVFQYSSDTLGTIYPEDLVQLYYRDRSL